MVSQPRTKTKITATEFFQLPEINTPHELIHGEVVMSPTPVPSHQRLVFKFGKLIDGRMPDGEVFIAPLSVFLDEHNVLEPDVIWVSDSGQCVVGERSLHGAPDLTVEALSPSTARRDKTVKFRLYQQHGVREYWLADPEAEYVEVWRLEAGAFVHQGVFGPEDAFESVVLGGKIIDLSQVFPKRDVKSAEESTK